MDYQQYYCFGYFDLEERGFAEICLVYFWKDYGETDLDGISKH